MLIELAELKHYIPYTQKQDSLCVPKYYLTYHEETYLAKIFFLNSTIYTLMKQVAISVPSFIINEGFYYTYIKYTS